MKQSDWLEANSRSAYHKISFLSMWNPKESLLRWRKHKDVPILSHFNPIHNFAAGTCQEQPD